jgi:hypothetical protein
VDLQPASTPRVEASGIKLRPPAWRLGSPGALVIFLAGVLVTAQDLDGFGWRHVRARRQGRWRLP